jgi:hypothetical protein
VEEEEELAIEPSLLSQAVKKKEGNNSTGRWKASNSPMDGACMCVLFA